VKFNVRKSGYFNLDKLQGGAVGRHLHDLGDFTRLNEARRHEILTKRLVDLLRHATQTTMFYRGMNGANEWSSWPVMTKRALQDKSDDFISDAHRNKKLFEKWTSGSYGTPMRVLFSADKWARRNAEVIFYNRRAGLDVGDAYLHVSTDKKSAFHRWRKNTIVLDATRLDATWLEETVTVLQQNPGRVIVGFASALLALAEYGRDHAPAGSIRLGGAVSAAEPLPEHARVIIGEVFGCAVFNRYASTETGVLAFTGTGHEELQVNRSSYVIEVLAHDADRPVRTGEQGRVVVTDLFSHAMPLIRYDIGDLAVAGPPCEHGVESLSRVEGRVVEVIYDASGTRISWATIYDIFCDAPLVFQYQFCQVGAADYRLMLIKRDCFRQEDENFLRQRLVALLGESATLRFEYVQSIPALGSGKRPAITSEWKREESTANHD
jgi:phenylacetate-CoA ligase